MCFGVSEKESEIKIKKFLTQRHKMDLCDKTGHIDWWTDRVMSLNCEALFQLGNNFFSF